MENQKSEIKDQKSGLSRRDFLKIGAVTAAVTVGTASALEHWNVGTFEGSNAFAEQVVEEKWVKTTCALCPSGCGLEVRVVNGKAVKVEGNALHPLNQGVCCLKGQTALEILYSPERIQRPRIQTGARGSGDWQEISWEAALALLAGKLVELRQQGLAHTVALMHGELRGQGRSFVQRFLQAYGSPNLIGRESLGEGSVRLASFLTQGINGLPVYDLNNSSYVMAFGGNPLEAGRNVIGTLGALAFMRRGRPQRGKLVVVHPRLGITGVKADEWVPIRPGTYAALALGMANVMINSQLYDADFVRDFTFGFEDFTDEAGQMHMGFKRLVLEEYDLERVEKITGVAAATVARLAGEFATNRPAVAMLPTEAGDLSSGNALYTAMAVHALNALVGSIDIQGGVLTQRFPNVASWPDYDQDNIGQAGLAQPRFDGAGTVTLPLAASAYQNVAANVLAGGPYPLNLLMLLHANPVYELPNASFARALMQVPFVVSFASILDESAAHADLILPASSFLEVWGDDYVEGSGFAGVSLRQPVVSAVQDTRNPADVLLDLAARVGGPVAVALPFQDYRALVAARHQGIEMDPAKYESNGCWSEMVYFNARPGSPAWINVVGRDRLNAPQDGRFDFFSRELFALVNGQRSVISVLDLNCLPHFEAPEVLKADVMADEFPLVLVSQSLITQSANWQGILPTLQECYGLQGYNKWRSWVEISPKVAKALDLKDGDLAWVESELGKVQADVRVYAGLWPNAIFLPQGQGHRTLVRWGRNAPQNLMVGANPNSLFAVGTEALSGLAVTGMARVRVYKA